MIMANFFLSDWLFGFVGDIGDYFFAPVNYNSSNGMAPNPDFYFSLCLRMFSAMLNRD